MSRNEVEKLRLSASNKTALCDTLKHKYGDALVKTNAFRQRYYYELLPGVLDELQDLEQRRIELIRHGILSCIAKEREVSYFESEFCILIRIHAKPQVRRGSVTTSFGCGAGRKSELIYQKICGLLLPFSYYLQQHALVVTCSKCSGK